MINGFDETTGTIEEILASKAAYDAAQTETDADDSVRKLEKRILKYPIFEYAFGNTEDIPFSDKVLQICRHDCLRYGKCWACPPHAGSIFMNIQKLKSYRHYMMFSSMVEVQDAMIFDQCIESKRPHEEITRAFRRELQETWKSRFYMLSAGCMCCESCACPDEPCRHPEERMMTTESHGIVLMQLVDQKGLGKYEGGNEIPWYSMMFFD